MGDRFQMIEGDRFLVTLSSQERDFLGDVTTMLRSVDPADSDDQASTRLRLPVYLDDAGSTEEWWRLMGDQLESARSSDRLVFDMVMGAGGGELVLDADEAEALLRVLNEGRLVLASRLGIQISSDFDDIDDGSRLALDFLHWLLEDLTNELSLRF